jgi:chromosome segregation ATPase
MPSGHPKDPVAHAAVLEANRAKRAEEKKSDEALEALRSKLTGQPMRTIAEARKENPEAYPSKTRSKRQTAIAVGKAKRTYTQRGTKNTVTISASEVRIHELEKELKSTQAHRDDLEDEIGRLRMKLDAAQINAGNAERRMFTVLDLASSIS